MTPGRSLAPTHEQILEATRDLVRTRLERALAPIREFGLGVLLEPGKMLRSRLAARCAVASTCVDHQAVQACCAAVELAHTGTLCHDDVIDGGVIRRSMPTLWCRAGQSAAVLVGDMLLCEAIDLVLGVEGGRWASIFMRKVQQTAGAEVRQELLLRGDAVDGPSCVEVARDKTGALFSFPAMLCGGKDSLLTAALEECGYLVGTAYQLADDLLDVVGSQTASGKTLGTDASRGKETLAGKDDERFTTTRQSIRRLCVSALATVHAWPAVQQAVGEFFDKDLAPLLAAQQLPVSLPAVPQKGPVSGSALPPVKQAPKAARGAHGCPAIPLGIAEAVPGD